MVAKDKAGNSASVPGIIIEDKHNVRRYLRSIERRIAAIKREINFDEQDSILTELDLEKLQNHNMKLSEKLS